MVDLVGKKLKDFYVLRRFGRGAMAEVYLAEQRSLGRQVALKVLNPELSRDPNYVRRFHHEARAAAALVHPGIVQIYEVGEQDGLHYIAQEYVAGRNLGEVIRTRGSLEPRLVLDVLCQVAAALSKAASAGIVHRDIKPENIMLAAATGEVKVADFGLARAQGDAGANLTQIGMTMGTPLYMSPEQIEGRALDSRSDIYSLGVTAYHMLTGEPPFNGDSPLSVAVLHLNHAATPLRHRSPHVPPRLAGLVDRMLAKKPDDRFADPSALLTELRAVSVEGAQQGWAAARDAWSLVDVIQSAEQRAAATARLEQVMKSSRPSGLRNRHAWSLAALAGCLLLGFAMAALTRPRYLLADARFGPAPYDDVWEQLLHAKRVNTEQAWLAALNHPKADRFYHSLLAKEGLAYYYLVRAEQYEKAIRPLQELADLGDSQPAFQAFGIAGLVVAYAKLDDVEQAAFENSRLTPQMRAVLQEKAPQMAELLSDTLDQMF